MVVIFTSSARSGPCRLPLSLAIISTALFAGAQAWSSLAPVRLTSASSTNFSAVHTLCARG